MGYLKKPGAAEGSVELGSSEEDLAWASTYPAVWEFLVASSWAPGEPRQTGTVLLVVDEGAVKAWVHDRDGSRSAWLSSGGVASLLGALDGLLREDGLDWRPDKKGGRKGR